MVEVETDKAVVEIPARRAGVVLHHGAPAGATIAVESLLVVIGEAGESWVPRAGTARHRTGARAAATPARSWATSRRIMPMRSAPVRGSRAPLPLVRRLAAATRRRSAPPSGAPGRGGRILRSDVEARSPDVARRTSRGGRAPASRMCRPTRSRRIRPQPHAAPGRRSPTSPPSARPIAASLLGLVPCWHAPVGDPMPLEALLILPVLPVLREFPVQRLPRRRAPGATQALRHRGRRGHPGRPVVAVVRAADTRDVARLSAEVVRLAAAARARTIAAPADLRGATFTISNIGAANGGWGTPLVPYGTVAILSIGRAKERPIARDGLLAVAPVMPLSLSFDHRVADGASGRRFLTVLIENLSEPALLLANG